MWIPTALGWHVKKNQVKLRQHKCMEKPHLLLCFHRVPASYHACFYWLRDCTPTARSLTPRNVLNSAFKTSLNSLQKMCSRDRWGNVTLWKNQMHSCKIKMKYSNITETTVSFFWPARPFVSSHPTVRKELYSSDMLAPLFGIFGITDGAPSNAVSAFLLQALSQPEQMLQRERHVQIIGLKIYQWLEEHSFCLVRSNSSQNIQPVTSNQLNGPDLF